MDTNAKQQQLYSCIFNEQIKTFIDNFVHRTPHKKHTNWFVKIEIMLFLSIVNATKSNQNLIKHQTMLGLTLKLLTCLSQEMTVSIISLLDDVIFNLNYYTDALVSNEQLNEWRNIYVDTIISSLKMNKVNVREKMFKTDNYVRIFLLSLVIRQKFDGV